jgi:hypothetical protein
LPHTAQTAPRLRLVSAVHSCTCLAIRTSDLCTGLTAVCRAAVLRRAKLLSGQRRLKQSPRLGLRARRHKAAALTRTLASSRQERRPEVASAMPGRGHSPAQSVLFELCETRRRKREPRPEFAGWFSSPHQNKFRCTHYDCGGYSADVGQIR